MTEFDDVIRRLRNERPEATPVELDQIKLRVRRSAARGSRRSQPMKSRLAILATLVVGMLFTTAGAGVAVTSVATDTNAASQQYGGGGTKPEQPVVPTPPSSGVEGVTKNTPKPANTSPAAVQPAQQVAAGATSPQQVSGNSLPFTGFAAIPVMLIGIALLTAGVMMRRRSARDGA